MRASIATVLHVAFQSLILAANATKMLNRNSGYGLRRFSGWLIDVSLDPRVMFVVTMSVFAAHRMLYVVWMGNVRRQLWRMLDIQLETPLR